MYTNLASSSWWSVVNNFIHWLFYITSMSLYFHNILELYNLQVSFMNVWLLHTVVIFHCIRSKDNKNHLFIHLNLCIALALGLVVFITGIESATKNEVVISKWNIQLTVWVHYVGHLHICSSTLTVFIHICFLLDVVWRSVSLHDVGHCVW